MALVDGMIAWHAVTLMHCMAVICGITLPYCQAQIHGRLQCTFAGHCSLTFALTLHCLSIKGNTKTHVALHIVSKDYLALQWIILYCNGPLHGISRHSPMELSNYI